MEHLQVTIRTQTSPSINSLMAALVAELAEAEDDTTFDPLAERLTLLAVWADLCRLGGEPVPTAIRRALGAPARPRSTATVSDVPVTRLCGRLLAELLADDVPDPLSQRYRLGLLWVDLCRLAGETPPDHVAALLDAPAATPSCATPARAPPSPASASPPTARCGPAARRRPTGTPSSAGSGAPSSRRSTSRRADSSSSPAASPTASTTTRPGSGASPSRSWPVN